MGAHSSPNTKKFAAITTLVAESKCHKFPLDKKREAQNVQPYTPQYLHDQAKRTAPTRYFFYQQTIWHAAPICLDIGCGAGSVTPEMTQKIPQSTAIGFDIDLELLTQGAHDSQDNQALHFLLADATSLPFRAGIIDFAFDHFTLLWIPNRMQALKEITETLRPHGILACIEPDYAGRIELFNKTTILSPKPPFPIVTALIRLGADPFTGGHLPRELRQLPFDQIQYGILSWKYDAEAMKTEIQSEAQLLQEKGIEWNLPAVIYTPIFWIYARKFHKK